MSDQPATTRTDEIAAANCTAALPNGPAAESSRVSRRLRMRASTLRRDANIRLAPLAAALRRRAAELELQAYLLDNRLQPIPVNTR